MSVYSDDATAGSRWVLALQLELCSPGLIASCVETRWRPSGFRPGLWPQGQSNESTRLSRLPRSRAARLERPRNQGSFVSKAPAVTERACASYTHAHSVFFRFT